MFVLNNTKLVIFGVLRSLNNIGGSHKTIAMIKNVCLSACHLFKIRNKDGGWGTTTRKRCYIEYREHTKERESNITVA